MRFIHTSDWHPGKSLKGESLLDDQAHILDEIIRAVDEQKADAPFREKHFDRYQYVVFDLQGCRTSNMNEAIK